MERIKPFVITLVGAESSGKTTLARQLAEHYGCLWVPECARKYLEGLGRPYEERDLVVMAERQLEVIEKAISSLQSAVGSWQSSVLSRQSSVGSWQSTVHSPQSAVGSRKAADENHQTFVSGVLPEDWLDEIRLRPMIVIDGGMLTLRMWARIKYGTTIPVVEEALESDLTSLYLLCRPTIPWEPDPLREAPLLLDRVWIYNQYLKELGEMMKPFHIVNVNVDH
jgi:nicotinamide riboside kinase